MMQSYWVIVDKHGRADGSFPRPDKESAEDRAAHLDWKYHQRRPWRVVEYVPKEPQE